MLENKEYWFFGGSWLWGKGKERYFFFVGNREIFVVLIVFLFEYVVVEMGWGEWGGLVWVN